MATATDLGSDLAMAGCNLDNMVPHKPRHYGTNFRHARYNPTTMMFLAIAARFLNISVVGWVPDFKTSTITETNQVKAELHVLK